MAALTVAEFAKQVGFSVSTVRKWIAEGRAPGVPMFRPMRQPRRMGFGDRLVDVLDSGHGFAIKRAIEEAEPSNAAWLTAPEAMLAFGFRWDSLSRWEARGIAPLGLGKLPTTIKLCAVKVGNAIAPRRLKVYSRDYLERVYNEFTRDCPESSGDLVSIAEAARRSGMSEVTVRRLVRTGKLPAVRRRRIGATGYPYVLRVAIPAPHSITRPIPHAPQIAQPGIVAGDREWITAAEAKCRFGFNPNTLNLWRRRGCAHLADGEQIRFLLRGRTHYFLAEQLETVRTQCNVAREKGWRGAGAIPFAGLGGRFRIGGKHYLSLPAATLETGIGRGSIYHWIEDGEIPWLPGRPKPEVVRRKGRWVILESQLRLVASRIAEFERFGFPTGGALANRRTSGPLRRMSNRHISIGRKARDKPKTAPALIERNDWLLDLREQKPGLTNRELLEHLRDYVKKRGKRWPLFTNQQHLVRTLREWAVEKGRPLEKKKPGRRPK